MVDIDSDFVELSIGTVDFRRLTNGILNRALVHSTVRDDVLNYHLFYAFLELDLLRLSKRKWRNLSVSDGLKIRGKIKDILSRHGVLEYVESKVISSPEVFSSEAVNVFAQQEVNAFSKLGGKQW